MITVSMTSAIMLSVNMLCAFMLIVLMCSVVMLNVNMLCVFILSVILLNVLSHTPVLYSKTNLRLG